MGIAGDSCKCIAEDMAKIFEVYWLMGASEFKTPPSHWSTRLHTTFNINNPMRFKISPNIETNVYISVSQYID